LKLVAAKVMGVATWSVTLPVATVRLFELVVAVTPFGAPLRASVRGALKVPCGELQETLRLPVSPAERASEAAEGASVHEGAAMVSATGTVWVAPAPLAVSVAV
jgi:hypothetical protein